MTRMHPIYFPREDSEILAHQVKNHASGVVLDVGTGTGIQAQSAAMNKFVSKVYGVDINPAAIKFCLANAKSNNKIEYFVSDLFSAFKNGKLKSLKFDTVVFNPPYLPADHEKEDIALVGGKKGYEVLERFLNEVNDFLAPEGIVLIVFSSLTNKLKVDGIIAENLLEKKVLHTTRFFYETLYVYLLKKNPLARSLSLLGVKNLKYLAKGKRKIVYTGIYKNKKVAIKAVLPGKKTTSIHLESFYLEKLNKHKIGPKLLYFTNEFLIAEFVEGVFLKDFMQAASRQQLKWFLKEVLRQCFVMDNIGINKDEMHHPVKHILVRGKKVTMIDFERCRHTADTKNVTQFCQFLASNSDLLKSRGFSLNRSEVIFHAQEYKRNRTKKNFNNILKLLDKNCR